MVATSIIQPLDMVKVQIQLKGEGAKGKGVSPFSVVKDLLQKGGPLAFYKGLSAGLLRQATYTTARLGIFRSLSNAMQGESKAPLPFWKKTLAGLAAGGLGAVFGTPADVALIRMQADSNLPAADRRNYKGVVNALTRITREEGLNGLFAGNSPVVLRAMALNVGMLATHDQALEELKKYTNATSANIGAKLISGFFASFFSLPFDFIKTRLQKQKRGPDGSLQYRGFFHCFSQVLQKEGPGAFYRGFSTYYFRIAPHAMITLAVLDELNKFTKNW
jgi:solute carrier family 25 oxoglutarate transporter 11